VLIRIFLLIGVISKKLLIYKLLLAIIYGYSGRIVIIKPVILLGAAKFVRVSAGVPL